jgi:hypothetical protein
MNLLFIVQSVRISQIWMFSRLRLAKIKKSVDISSVRANYCSGKTLQLYSEGMRFDFLPAADYPDRGLRDFTVFPSEFRDRPNTVKFCRIVSFQIVTFS